MARFNFFYYLFAVMAVLALVANARPADEPDTGSVAGMPGMAAELDKGNKNGDSSQLKHTISDNEEYMDDMENALEAAANV